MKKTTEYARNCARRQADPSSIYRVMSRVQPFTPEEIARLAIPVRIAYDLMKSGKGEYEDFTTLAYVANVCIVEGEKISRRCVEAARSCQYALDRCRDRFDRTGLWGFDGPAISEVLECIDFHEQLLELRSPIQLQNALRETLKRMDKGIVL